MRVLKNLFGRSDTKIDAGEIAVNEENLLNAVISTIKTDLESALKASGSASGVNANELSLGIHSYYYSSSSLATENNYPTTFGVIIGLDTGANYRAQIIIATNTSQDFYIRTSADRGLTWRPWRLV